VIRVRCGDPVDDNEYDAEYNGYIVSAHEHGYKQGQPDYSQDGDD